jgi:hypothetical protein
LEEARTLLIDGRDHAQKAQERFLLWRFHAALARLNQRMGNDAGAEEELAAARVLIQEMAATLSAKDLAESFSQRAIEKIMGRSGSSLFDKEQRAG